MNQVKKKKKNKEGEGNHIPFIQFFSGWKWKAVLCHVSMAFVHGNFASALRNIGTDFSDTPSETPLGRTHVLGPEEKSSKSTTIEDWCCDWVRGRGKSSSRRIEDKERRRGGLNLIDLRGLAEKE